MSIYFCKKSRRQFLVGAGKSLLAMPLLPSLLTSEARAQAMNVSPKLMVFLYDHNNPDILWPQPNRATTPIGNDGAREIALRSLMSNGVIGPAFTNARYTSLINNNLMTMVRGFRTQTYYGPAHGNHMLSAGAHGQREDNGLTQATFDTVIENSPSVYPSGTPLSVQRAIRFDLNGGYQYAQRVGNSVTDASRYGFNITNFYNDVFSSLTNGTTPPQDLTNQLKSNILNRIHASYQSTIQSRRISNDDRLRLTQRMDWYNDLMNSFGGAQQPTLSCNRPANPGNTSGDRALTLRHYLQLMAIAFQCGLTRMGSMNFDWHDPQWVPNNGAQGNGIHGAIHGANGPAIQNACYTNMWRYYSDMVAEHFLAPLEAIEGDTGRSYLDNMLVTFASAGGIYQPDPSRPDDGGHNGYDSQQIFMGTMGGRVRGGRYIALPRNFNTPVGGFQNADLMPINCFAITMLHLMGVPASEYRVHAPGGQGFGHYGGDLARSNYAMRHRFYSPITEMLT